MKRPSFSKPNRAGQGSLGLRRKRFRDRNPATRRSPRFGRLELKVVETKRKAPHREPHLGSLQESGGERGIRTPDRVAPMPHFECGAFNHSAISPRGAYLHQQFNRAVAKADPKPDVELPEIIEKLERTSFACRYLLPALTKIKSYLTACKKSVSCDGSLLNRYSAPVHAACGPGGRSGWLDRRRRSWPHGALVS